MALLLNEYPYSDYQKINLDWLLDLGNKLKADAESGVFNGADGAQGERGYGVYGGSGISIVSYSEYIDGTIVTYPYTVDKIYVPNAVVNDFILGTYNNLVIVFKVTNDIGSKLVGFSALTLTGPQGPQGVPGEGAITEAQKQAILQLARKVAYIDGNGQTYYNALYTAFYGGTPVVVLDSITAVFNQGNTVVYDTDTLDSLKAMLTVTAHYSDNTTAIVPSTDYTLSGTLTAGTSVITVSYSGETTTFNVTVTATGALYPFVNGTHTFTDNNRTLTITNGNHFSYSAPNATASATPRGAYLNLSSVNSNDTSGTTSSNINLSTLWFTIPANANLVLNVKNITFTRLSETDVKYAIGVRYGSTVIITTPDVDTNTDITVTESTTTTKNVACVFAYIRNQYQTFEADIELYVNGDRWI